MKVRVKLRFRGRQRAHKEIGFQVVNKFIKEAGAYGQADAPPKMLGDRDLNVVISPLPRDKRGKAPRPAAAPKPAAVAGDP
jgi:translation initiation factor IF-3